MKLLTYVAPKFKTSALEILARHTPSSNGLSMAYQEYSFNVLSNGLRLAAEDFKRARALYKDEYR